FNKSRMWHIGRGGGFTAVISRFIDDDACIIILSNFNFTFIDTIANKVAAIIFGQPYELPKKRRVVALNPEHYNAYIGTYENPEFTAQVTYENDYLFIEVAGQPKYMLFPESPTEFFMKESEATISFIQDNQGNMVQVVIHQDGHDIP